MYFRVTGYNKFLILREGHKKFVLDEKQTKSRNLAFWTKKRNSQFWTKFGQKMAN